MASKEYEKLIDWLKDELKEMARSNREEHKIMSDKIDSISKFRWKTIGGLIATSVITASLCSIISIKIII